ncbi:MAG: hypothetical protein GX947_07150 [Tissierellia bacterium]|nr:hypothetical protein [Tissierellia bacterium]
MNLETLQKGIIEKDGIILTEGTLNPEHLLPTYYDFLVKYNINELADKIKAVFSEEPTTYNSYYSITEMTCNSEEAHYLLEEIYDFFNEIAPLGYCFSSHVGDGACFGFWKICEE